MHLVGFIMRIYHDARSPERQIWVHVSMLVRHKKTVAFECILEKSRLRPRVDSLAQNKTNWQAVLNTVMNLRDVGWLNNKEPLSKGCVTLNCLVAWNLSCMKKGIKMIWIFKYFEVQFLKTDYNNYMSYLETAVAQWLRCCATNRKVAGLIPAGVIGIFHWHKIFPIALWPWGRLSL